MSESAGPGLAICFPSSEANIEGLVRRLLQDRPDTDRFKMFDTLAFVTAEVFGDMPEPLTILDTMEDETKRMALMLHPAAAPLFAYMLTALQRFNLTRPQDIDDSIDTDEVMDRLDTSEKRAKLAEAFGLTGPKGERWLPRGRDSSLAAVFELEVQRELINGGHDESASGQVLRGAVRKGLLRTFFSRHGFEYEPGVRIHKDQMTALKKTLRAIGVRYLQDEKQ